ncbi:MAG: EF-hand domain-containing protein [Planctomycetales bacterium]|nr:EF-hand domain-containing protein [Planctomycetales bacterium]
MNRNKCNRLAIVLLLAVLAAETGCSRGPTAVEVPPIEPESMAAAAFTQYDTNGDSLLDESEMKACPALLDAMKNQIDKDNDKRISKEELVNRFAMWSQGGIGAAYLACRITKNGVPVEGALVRLIPDPCFGGVIQPAEGKTSSSGRASMAMDSSNLPEDLQNVSAVQQGLYRVEITHASFDIPAKYNTESILGVEVSSESGRNVVEIKL